MNGNIKVLLDNIAMQKFNIKKIHDHMLSVESLLQCCNTAVML